MVSEWVAPETRQFLVSWLTGTPVVCVCVKERKKERESVCVVEIESYWGWLVTPGVCPWDRGGMLASHTLELVIHTLSCLPAGTAALFHVTTHTGGHHWGGSGYTISLLFVC